MGKRSVSVFKLFVIMSVFIYFVSSVKLLSHLNKKAFSNSKCVFFENDDKNAGFIQVDKRVQIHHHPEVVNVAGAFLEVKQSERRKKVDDEISFDDEDDSDEKNENCNDDEPEAVLDGN